MAKVVEPNDLKQIVSLERAGDDALFHRLHGEGTQMEIDFDTSCCHRRRISSVAGKSILSLCER
jgi:hypothetical protein